MAVFMVYGKPGSGKSCWTVGEVVLKELIQKRRKVITNLSLNMKYLQYSLDVDPDLVKLVETEKGDFSDTFQKASDYKDEWRNEKGQAPVVIVDEAHFSLNNRGNNRKQDVEEILDFFSTHRQAGYDVYLITQDPSRIPKDVLGYIDVYYQVKKQRQLSNNAFTVYVRDCDKQKTVMSQKTGTYPKETFKAYKSHLLSNGNIEEDNDVNGVGKIWFSWPFIMFYCLAALLTYGFTFGGLSLNPFAFLDSEEKTVLKDDVDIEKIDFVSVDGEPIKKPDNQIIDDIQTFEEKIEVVEEIKEVKYLSQSHPFDGKLLQIRSWVGDTAFMAVYDKETKDMVSSIKSNTVEMMGYKVEKYSDCSMKLIYENINFFVDCSEIKKDEERATDKILSNVPTI